MPSWGIFPGLLDWEPDPAGGGFGSPTAISGCVMPSRGTSRTQLGIAVKPIPSRTLEAGVPDGITLTSTISRAMTLLPWVPRRHAVELCR